MNSIIIFIVVFLIQIATLLANDKIIHVIDFTGQENGSAISCLEKRFEFELDAKELNPRFENNALVISTKDKVAGLIGHRFEQHDFIQNFERVRIIWGVNRYPEGADWENGNNRVPIAVMLSFGTERFSSGLPFGIQLRLIS